MICNRVGHKLLFLVVNLFGSEENLCFVSLANMAAAGCLLPHYSSKEYLAISLVQVVSAWTAVAFSNYALEGVSLISTPARSCRLFCGLYFVLCFSLLRLKSRAKFTASQLIKLVILLLGSCVSFHVIAVLFGAPLSEQSEETFCWALLVSHLVILPASSLLGTQLELIPKIFCSTWSDATPEAYFQCSITCTLVGAWIGAFPIPLDWDRPWQVWPIPCVIGAIVGYITGLGASTVLVGINEKRLRLH